MGYQRVEAFIAGDDVEIGFRILRREFAHVERDMEVQRVGAVAGDLQVIGFFCQEAASPSPIRLEVSSD